MITTNESLRVEPLTFPWKTQDPFLFCAYHKDDYPIANGKMGPKANLEGRRIGQDFASKDGWNMYHGEQVPGFPAHPHYGFETITIAKQGMVDHSDSLGAAGRFGNGDVQWMTAGKGVQHCEMFPLLDDENKNPFELFQIWLNLPRNNKGVNPHFGMLWKEKILTITEPDDDGNLSTIDLVTGNYKNHKVNNAAPDSWAAKIENEVAIWTIKMEEGASLTLPTSSDGVNRTLYFYEGHHLFIDAHQVGSQSMVSLNTSKEYTITNGNKVGYLLYLQGKPILEPVVQYGPFVVNEQHEISQVIKGFQKTQFGGWPWGSLEHTHPKDAGRFAKHADGRLEKPL